MAITLTPPVAQTFRSHAHHIALTPTLHSQQIFSNMRSYVNLVVLALIVSLAPALSAPTPYRYGNLLVEFKCRAF